MKHQCPHRHNLIAKAISLSFLSLTSFVSSHADTVDLGVVGGAAGAAQNNSVKAERGTAASVAPTQANLSSTEPQSIISRSYIEESTPLTGNFNTITGIAPSVATMPATGGPGLSDQKMSMRGFQDGEYNVTFDGIPFGDANGPTHHSTAYFPAPIIGGMVIERGPGNASNIGYSTYGGSVNILSKAPSETASFGVYGSLGTWNTQLEGAGWESGRMADTGSTLQVNVQHMQSKTYIINENIYEENLTVKYQRPIAESSLLTLFASPSKTITDNPDGGTATVLQQQTFGLNYGTNNNPASQGFSGYNTQVKTTDMEYAKVQSDWGKGVQTNNTAYTYAYVNNTIAGQDPTQYGVNGDASLAIASSKITKILPSGLSASSTPASPLPAGDVGGYLKLNEYRVYGDIFKYTNKFDTGLLRAGVWWETADAQRHNFEADLSTGGTILHGVNGQPAGVVTTSNFAQQYSDWHQTQPFVEYEWKVTDKITVTPGYKYMNYTMDLSSQSNQKAQMPQAFNFDFHASLPFLTVNQKLSPNDSVYAQYAQGMEIPWLQYGGTTSTAAPQPQTTTNYQLGYVHKSDKFTWDTDIYYIPINNYMLNTGTTQNPIYTNAGGALYKGLEGEATYMLGRGYAVYGNFGINSAYFTGGAPGGSAVGNGPTPGAAGTEVPSAPTMTSAVGFLYNLGPWNASLIYKHIGEQLNGSLNTQIPAIEYTDLNISYKFKDNQDIHLKNTKLQLSVFNLDNHQNVLTTTGPLTSASTQATYQAPRSFMISARTEFN